MENASKALIIAGSILLSILIIALGMYIFSSSTGSTENDTLSNLEVSTFNGKFNKYKGNQTGTQVNALLDALISNCNISKNSESELPRVALVGSQGSITSDSIAAGADGKYVDGKGCTSKSEFREIKELIESSHRYTVYMAQNPDTDLIHGIIISYKAYPNDAQKICNSIANYTTK